MAPLTGSTHRMFSQLIERDAERNPVAVLTLNLTAFHALFRVVSADRSIVLAATVLKDGTEYLGTITATEPEARGKKCHVHFEPQWNGPAFWVPFHELDYVGVACAEAAQDD